MEALKSSKNAIFTYQWRHDDDNVINLKNDKNIFVVMCDDFDFLNYYYCMKNWLK